MRALPLLCAACAATACTAPITPTGRWFGPLAPATPSALCTGGRASLLLSNGQATFTPDEGVWVLTGKAAPDGTITATRERPGGNKQPYVTRLEAHWTEATVTGTYTTPRCTYTLTLDRK